MDERFFDAFTRRTAVATLGASGFSAFVGLAQPPVVDAGNRTSKKKKNNGNDRKQCKKQVGQCITFLELLCEEKGDCNDPACCSFLALCNASEFLECIVESQQVPT